MARVGAYGKELGMYLEERLQAIGGVKVLTPKDPEMRAGITTFRTDIPYLDMYRALAGEHKLRCRIVSERGLNAIRVSTHIFNNKNECDRVADAVSKIIHG